MRLRHFELFTMVIDTAEFPRRFVAVTVTCDKTTPLLGDEAAGSRGNPM